MLSHELQSKVAIWRAKALDGTLSLEEMKQAIIIVREGRMAAATTASIARKTKAKAEIKSADDLLDEFLGDGP